ncbi:DUF6314 family protein [Cardinium endosymbiont of Culicoides punctatus]|uniref:DUF6314 family protein n=1 Tax=Cardinium endosymbiont of Culicoides punctatus TaxID=2304601 RepID=UPI0010583B48|nr:DUF6314 family protein [Cardinium endosymbiont of Culicoides punctatus]TDG95575.1 hypothetical protein CCPUN_01920 [Cardinium endosymbiont of Culicoides punctatus]
MSKTIIGPTDIKKITSDKIFHFIPGIWRISRKIESKTPYQNYEIDGYGSFTLSTDHTNMLLYKEKVVIYNPGKNIFNRGNQEYKYVYNVTTSSIYKYFKDGRLFYELMILDNTVTGSHVCIQDEYISNYTFGNNQFTLIYDVNGPLKSYKIITNYLKLS